MKKIVCVLLVLTGVSAFALDVTGTAPKVKGTGAEIINNEISSIFNSAMDEFKDMVRGIDEEPAELIKAFGNSGVYASHGATQRSFGGYKSFAVTAGTMMGFMLPTSPFKLVEEFKNINDKILNEGDISLGFSPQMLNAQLGMNMSFLLDGLYFGLRIGYFKISPENFFNNLFGDNLEFSFNTFVLGITANYQLLSPKNLSGLFIWRGLNLGTGFIFQNTDLKLSLELGDVIQRPIDPGLGQLEIEPRAGFDLGFQTITIPLEAITAINILFINIPVGLGVDLAFGKSSLGIGADAKISLKNLPAGIEEDEPGSLNIEAGGQARPKFLNPKLMTGLGFAIGPVLIDIPLTFYFTQGFNVGLTIGVAF